jgi:hypothetical protein
MSLAAAHRFILRVIDDNALRVRLNTTRKRAEIEAVLEESVGLFSAEMFEDAFRALHVKCQTAAQADELKEIRLWWLLVMATATPGPEQEL